MKELSGTGLQLTAETTPTRSRRSVLRPGSPVTEKYQFIESCKIGSVEYAYPVKKMCRWLAVSSSGFFAWKRREISATARRREELTALVVEIFADSDETYGYRRVHAELARRGVPVGLELVRSIMRDQGLVPCQPLPWRASLTENGGSGGSIPDLVNRDFTADAPGEKNGRRYHLHPDMGRVAVPGHRHRLPHQEGRRFAMDDNYKTPLIIEAVRMAARNVTFAHGAIFHSDRGSNYTSTSFATALAEHGVRQSVGRTGICYDNSMAESFFATLKNERVHRTGYPTRQRARTDIAQYIDLRYNTRRIRRIHSGLGYRTPQEVHDAWLDSREAA